MTIRVFSNVVKFGMMSAGAIIYAWLLPTLSHVNICQPLGSARPSISHYILETRCAGVFAFLTALPFAAWLTGSIDEFLIFGRRSRSSRPEQGLMFLYVNFFRLLLFIGWVLVFKFPNDFEGYQHKLGVGLVVAGSAGLVLPFGVPLWFDLEIPSKLRQFSRFIVIFSMAATVVFVSIFNVNDPLFLFYIFETVVYTCYCLLPIWANYCSIILVSRSLTYPNTP
jgi:hypothetical protein